MTPIQKRSYAPPPYDRREILRYAGVRGQEPTVEALLEECIAEMDRTLCYRLCFRSLPVRAEGDVLFLGSLCIRSHALATHVAGCDRMLLFAATVGMAPDRLMARYAAASPTKALLLQAIGTERIEALCDLFEAELAREQTALGYTLRSRFSPGYGDLPLTLQQELFTLLDCPRQIGLSLNESLLMSPTKSVTALCGLSPVSAESDTVS